MATHTKATLEPRLRELLAPSQCVGKLLYLRCGDLGRDEYKKVDDALRRLGGRWKGGKVRAHEFPSEAAPILASAMESGVLPARNADAFFATPPAVARRVVRLLAIPAGARIPRNVLEPSAGTGALVEAFREEYGCGHSIEAVEIDPGRAQLLIEKGQSCVRADFLSLRPGSLDSPYDAVMMNPPFSVAGDAQAWATHVLHAARFLKPGGVLAAVVPASVETATAGMGRSVRAMVEDCPAGLFEDVEDGAFKEAGTGARVRLIRFRKD